ncbi:hypothetical protein B566_EDAN016343 [Ephemera danica]|nr:hypothetical protein B566_EDAN016343 [Ephemera danica]
MCTITINHIKNITHKRQQHFTFHQQDGFCYFFLSYSNEAYRNKPSITSRDEDQRIIGGTAAQNYQFPWQVFITFAVNNQGYACGGSIIAPRWILTAAHCTARSSSFEIIVGATNLKKREPGVAKFVTDLVHTHSEYNSETLENDIALLELRRPMVLGKPISMAEAISLPRWSDVGKSFEEVNAVGDSGGPLIYEERSGAWTLIGVVSFGYPRCQYGQSYRRCSVLHPNNETDINEFAGITTFNDEDDRIIGGTAAQNYQFPWQVSIAFARSPFSSSIFEITVSATNLRKKEPGVTRYVTDLVHTHLEYSNETLENDIALLELRTPIFLGRPTSMAEAINLPRLRDVDRSFEGVTAVVSGWGQKVDGGPGSAILNYVDVPVISNEECNNDYKALGFDIYIYNSMICTSARNGTTTTCKGDSGGALIYKESSGVWTQIGIVSFGLSKCQQEQSSVYTRVCIVSFVDDDLKTVDDDDFFLDYCVLGVVAAVAAAVEYELAHNLRMSDHIPIDRNYYILTVSSVLENRVDQDYVDTFSDGELVYVQLNVYTDPSHVHQYDVARQLQLIKSIRKVRECVQRVDNPTMAMVVEVDHYRNRKDEQTGKGVHYDVPGHTSDMTGPFRDGVDEWTTMHHFLQQECLMVSSDLLAVPINLEDELEYVPPQGEV